MVNLLNKTQTTGPGHQHGAGDSYSGYQEPDTTVPPKARPVFDRVSVNGVEIAEQLILSEAQNHPSENPGEALLAAAKALAVKQLLLFRAAELDLTVDPETDDEGRSETKDDAIIRHLIETEVAVPQASEAECRRFYDKNQDRFTSEPLWEARHILIGLEPSGSKDAARSIAERLIGVLNERPVEFAALASEFSICTSAAQGGNLGQISRGSTVAEFEKALEQLDEGGMTTKPVESRYGFHIIQLDRKVEGRQLPFEMVQARIAGWLEASAWSKAVSQYIALLAADAEISGINLAGTDSPLVQ